MYVYVFWTFLLFKLPYLYVPAGMLLCSEYSVYFFCVASYISFFWQFSIFCLGPVMSLYSYLSSLCHHLWQILISIYHSPCLFSGSLTLIHCHFYNTLYVIVSFFFAFCVWSFLGRTIQFDIFVLLSFKNWSI